MPEAFATSSPRVAHPGHPAVGARLSSVALAVPETVVANAPIAERLGVPEDWILSRTGVRERRVARPEERLSDLAAQAGRIALERASVEGGDLDLVLVGTMSQDEATPNAAPLVAAELGTPRAAAIDVGAACTAFLSALAVGAAQIEAGRARTALVVGADLLTRFTDRDDKRTAGLFGDGAGAVVMTAAEAPGGIGPIALHSDGLEARAIYATQEERKLRMDGHETFKHAVGRLSEVTLEALELARLDVDDIDLFVYHQANGRILSAVGERVGLPIDRVVDFIGPYGNTSAGSIPIALALAQAEGRLSDGARVLLAAFGAGFVWGGGIVEWGAGDRPSMRGGAAPGPFPLAGAGNGASQQGGADGA